MRFEWDPEKAQSNREKHGVSFEEAMTVFYDSLSATFDDALHSVEEERLVILGYSARNGLLAVMHTERGNAIRIISARCATAHERRRYEERRRHENERRRS